MWYWYRVFRFFRFRDIGVCIERFLEWVFGVVKVNLLIVFGIVFFLDGYLVLGFVSYFNFSRFKEIMSWF